MRTTDVITAAAISAAAIILASSNAAAAGDPTGLWYDDTGRGAVEIRKCGSALCGNIVWLRNPTGKDGKPLTDKLNPNSKRRTRRICGLQVLGGVKPQADGSWDNGWIYDPKRGAAFDVQLTLDSPRRLRVMGYKGVKFLSKTLFWKRAPEGLTRCSGR